MNTDKDTSPDIGLSLSMLTLRIWLGLRSFQTGVEKFAGSESSETPVLIDGAANEYGLTETATEKAYALSNYNGVPEALYSKLSKEPLITEFFLNVYNLVLGPALLILGLTVLLGVATRISLFAMGLLYTSLTFGLILLKQDAGIAWLATHIVLIAMALALSQYNRWAVTSKW